MLYIIIVLYNEKINNSHLFYNIMNSKKYTIIYIDNSTDKNIIAVNKKINIFDNIYICSNGNIGLSKAYNLAINHIRNKIGLNENIWIMTLDDDTKLSQEYLSNVVKEMVKTNADVISGIVNDQFGNILSPIKILSSIKFFPLKREYIDHEGIYSNIVCINSGTVIRSTVFNYINYDEDLFLDMIDYKFFYDLIKIKKNKIHIINGKIEQSFSGKEYTDYCVTRKRFHIFKIDFTTFCKKTNINILYRNIFLIKRNISILTHFLFNERRK